jgi:hypothetical protein
MCFFCEIVFRIVPRIASLRQAALYDLSLLNFSIISDPPTPELRRGKEARMEADSHRAVASKAISPDSWVRSPLLISS